MVKFFYLQTNETILILDASVSMQTEDQEGKTRFDLGIDDYVTKPFSPKELLMRIKAVTNRFNRAKEIEEKERSVFIYKDLRIDFSAHQVFIDEVEVELTHKEYELLVLLMENMNIALTRDAILEKVWGSTNRNNERTLDTHVKSIRKKIGEYASNIVTIRRVGYRFEKR